MMKLVSCVALAAALLSIIPASAQEPKSAAASAAAQKEFNGFIAKFRAALKANDAAAIAGMAKLPFQNDAAIADAAQFRAKVYKPDFTAKTRACLQREKPVHDRDGDGNHTFSIGCGDNIFVFTRTAAGFLLTDIAMND
ncbi:hypothetical protein ACN6KF_000817 [Labrys sp. La1]|uniref:hypothetical protein n=1 Tax=Labrys sp. La1 TaxID=3404917 RepID=UPI003EBED3FD